MIIKLEKDYPISDIYEASKKFFGNYPIGFKLKILKKRASDEKRSVFFCVLL